MYTMEKYTTVSAKILVSVREKMRKRGIKPAKLFKKAIEEELKKETVEDLRSEAKKLHKILAKISIEDVVRDIREDRDSR
jgi:antitoxin CcdA